MIRTSALIVALAFAAPATAQSTIVVDSSGGPGSQYKELDKAISAAKDGDIILVRAGSYQWVTTTLSKGLTVQGVGPTTRISGRLRIDNLSGGRRFLLKDFALSDATIEVTSCRGPVLAAKLQAAKVGDSIRLAATSSLSVAMRRCTAMYLTSIRSFVRIEGGHLQHIFGARTATVEARHSLIELADAAITGGEYHIGHGFRTPTPAVNAVDSHIRARGRLSDLRVKAPSSVISSPAPVLNGDADSRLAIDPVVKTFQPVYKGPVIRGFGKGVARPSLPTLRAPATPVLGKLWTYSIQAKAGDSFAIAIGLPSPPLPFLGEFLQINPQALLVLNVGRLPASGEASFTIRHASQTRFRGELFVMQGIAGSAATLSNAIAVSVR